MADSIMIQGTMSNVGKSLITAGLCRIFTQDGYKTAPFKAQNMALNSYITRDGSEMGRAQAMQAESAKIEPDVSMNPILLKPSSDTGSQVIVNGRVIGNMTAREYFARKKEFIPDIMNAYKRLEGKNDIIVIEGAGSPAEINLKKDDIVNMGMAKMVNSPVLLVGDIDRGGVFAQLYGTVALLEEEEKRLIKGLLINKFRGDKTILESGLTKLEDIVRKPVMGVIPYTYCDIDDEDSLSERFERKKTGGLVDIAVIKLPRISNFTDFNAFERINGVSLRYVDRVYDLGNPDIIIIPGTKSTVDSLIWLRESGMEMKIKQLSEKNTLIFGICGGYQILGESITDLDGTEKKGSFTAMGLLPIKTVFRGKTEKTMSKVSGKFTNIGGAFSELKGKAFFGYEIHSAISEITDGSEPMTTIGGVCKKNVYGSYVHGIFDETEIVGTIVRAVLNKKGIAETEIENFDLTAYKERQYDILADAVRKNVDMDKIYEIVRGR